MPSLIQAIREGSREARINDCCHYGFKRKNNTLSLNFNRICFFELGDRNEVKGPIKELRFFINQHQKYNSNRLFYKYWKWVINESPFSNAFLNKKAKPSKYLVNGIKMNVSKNSTYVVAAMTALRVAYEFPKFLASWYSFQKKGLSKELSFVLANLSDHEGHIGVPNSNHAVLDIDFTIDSFKSFKKKEMPRFLFRMGMDCFFHNYRGVFSLFNPFKGDPSTVYSLLKPFLIQRGRGWGTYSEINWKNTELINKLKEIDK